MKRTLQALLIFVLLSIVTISISAQELRSTTKSLFVDDLERTYQLYVPDNHPDKLLFVLHPTGSNGRAMELITGFNEVADERGYVVAYLNMVGYYWDDGRVEGGIPNAEEPLDDYGFFLALIDELTNRYEIEPSQVYLAGLDQGGLMAYAVACDLPEYFAGIAVLDALMWEYHSVQCDDAAQPINLLVVHGQATPWYVEEGEELNYIGRDLSFKVLGKQETLDFWLERSQCDAESIKRFDNSLLEFYDSCDGNTITAYLSVQNNNSTWPRIASSNRYNNTGINGSQLIAAFFERDENWVDWAIQEASEKETARSFRLYIPSSYDPQTPMPLVILLHGRHNTAGAQAYASDFNAVAEREGIIALYPNGLETQWNYYYGLPGMVQANSDPNDDIFLATLIDDIALDLNIDAARVYVTGLSNGGFMTQRLACTQQSRYAAFASVAATGPMGLQFLCADSNPIPILYVQGVADEIVPWEGIRRINSDGVPYYETGSMEETFAYWAQHNGCDPSVVTEILPQMDEKTSTHFVQVEGCPEDAPVAIYMVIGGGHVWPGIRPKESDFLGNTSMDFNASEVIWDFFKERKLPERDAAN